MTRALKKHPATYRTTRWDTLLALACALSALVGCTGDDPAQVCQITGETPDSVSAIGCLDDFEKLASLPLDASIPGARSAKIVIDRSGGDILYFQNSKKYPIHWDFASQHLSGNGLPVVGSLGQFNSTEYYAPDRRFILGAVTRYEGPGLWVFEIAPYDTASADMITTAFRAISDNSYFGSELAFHPTSESVATSARELPDDIEIVTTEQIFADIDYQPLNLAEAYGQLRFVAADTLGSTYVGFRDIVVLDKVPNDISVVSGIITGEFQTPLAHINVLSQNRRTPNMALRGAMDDPALRALEGRWVKLDVDPFEWSITEVSQEEADAWWDEHRPPAVQVPGANVTEDRLLDVGDLLDPDLDQYARIQAAIPAFGGKASHYAELSAIEGVPVPRAFAIPLHYYDQFMTEHGFKQRIAELLEDPAFRGQPEVRDAELLRLRQDMQTAPIDPVFLAALIDKLRTEYPGTRMRFRSSTNAEDLDGFTGAGLYRSASGDPDDPNRPVADAIRKVWASVWSFRAFEERSYRSISHLDVGMALLVHRSFPDEEANGVAVTANPFDPSGIDPAFYINVQLGEESVVKPEPGISTDELLYQYNRPGQPVIYLRHSNLVPAGESVLDSAQLYSLGTALDAIHNHFYESYGPPVDDPGRFYGMDVEFKFDDLTPGTEPVLQVKQARPHPGRGQ